MKAQAQFTVSQSLWPCYTQPLPIVAGTLPGLSLLQVLRRQKQQLQLAQGFASGNLEQPMLAAASPANSPTSARAASSPTNLAQGVAPLPWQHQQGQQQQQPSHHHGGSSTAAAPCAGSTGGSDWTQRKILRVMGVVVAGGALAGLLGIGGGMVIGPLLLGELALLAGPLAEQLWCASGCVCFGELSCWRLCS